jgi:serine phosphatase RsbU (regulator of sigma subunit)
MAHDALHADVLEVLRATVERRGRAEPLRVLAGDVADFRFNVERADRVPVPDDLAAALDDLRPAQLAYAQHALELGDEAVRSPASVRPELNDFQDEFGRLQTALAQVTDQLAEAQAASQVRAGAAQRRAERNILAAAGLALSGLLALSAALAHMGRRVGTLLRQERAVAETLQRSLLPARLPDLPGIELAARFLPSEVGAQVGGDWYDAIALGGGDLALVIGDVTGHDIGAASAMGSLRNALRAWSVVDLPPAALLDRLNAMLFAFEAEHLATCVYLRLGTGSAADDDTDTVTVLAANAGHCPPLVVSPTGQVRLLEAQPCPPLGAVVGVAYSQQTYEVERGSTVLLYTDGLVECHDVLLDEGLQLLRRVAAEASGRGRVDLQAFCDEVVARLTPDGPATDDVALLAVRTTLLTSGVLPGPRSSSEGQPFQDR